MTTRRWSLPTCRVQACRRAWPALLAAVTRAGHAATNGVPHGILSSGRPVGEQTTAVAAWPSRPPTYFATKKPGALAADAGMGVRALSRGTFSLTPTLAARRA